MPEFREEHGVLRREEGVSLSLEPNGVDRILVTDEALEDCFQIQAVGNTTFDRTQDMNEKKLSILEANPEIFKLAAREARRLGSMTEDGRMPVVTRKILEVALKSHDRR